MDLADARVGEEQFGELPGELPGADDAEENVMNACPSLVENQVIRLRLILASLTFEVEESVRQGSRRLLSSTDRTA
ncbi:hypothetical protein ACFQ51_38820 [Streptomyces kaempferi]